MTANIDPTGTTSGGRTIDIVAALRRQWYVPVICAIVAALLAFGYTQIAEERYVSTATVLLEKMGNEAAPGGGLGRTLDVESQATLARSTILLQSMADRLDSTTPAVRRSTTAAAAPTGDVLLLTFSDESAQVAAEGATVYAEEFLALRKSVANEDLERQRTSLEAQRDELETSIGDLTARLQDLEVTGSNAEQAAVQQSLDIAIEKLADVRSDIANIDTDETSGRVVVDPATAVVRDGLPKRATIAGAFAAGLVLGLILALIRDRADDRYGSVVDVGSIGVDEVGRVRYVPDPLAPAYANDWAARRSYGRLLMRACFAPDPTAPEADGRSTCVVAVESRTLPPDASSRIVDALQAEGEPNAVRVVVPALTPQAVGEGGPSFWDRVPQSLGTLASKNDVVLVPAPPLDASSTGLAVAASVDRTLLAVTDRTRVADIVDAIDDLHSVGQDDVEVVVVTRAPRSAPR